MRGVGRLAAPAICAGSVASGLVFISDNACRVARLRRARTRARRYAQRLDSIAALARELVDVDDGLPVVSAVTRPAFEHAGERASSLPHLVAAFSQEYLFPRRNIAAPRPYRAPRPDNIRSGNHDAGGFVFAIGPAAGVAMAQVKSMKDFASLATKVLVMPEQKPTATG